MKLNATDPRFEFRVFGQHFGRTVASVIAAFPVEERDEGVETYLLSPTNQHYNVKIRDGKLDVKLLMRQHLGLERWHPYLQLAFPLTAAFLQEFCFAWLDVEPPLLRRYQYTARQFFQELVLPHAELCDVQVYKQRRHFTVNDCKLEITSLSINGEHTVKTIAVEAADPDVLLNTIELLHLHTLENTNYIVGLRHLLGKEALFGQPWGVSIEHFAPLAAPAYVMAR